MLQVANSQMLKHQIAAQTFEMQRKGIEAGQHDIEFSQNQAKWMTDTGGKLMQHVEDLPGLTKFMR